MAKAPLRIKLITFDAYNTLFKPKGSLSAQYAQEAAKYGVHVSKADITRHFGQCYKAQLERAPFYGRSQKMSTRTWWEELVYSTFLSTGVSKQELDPVFGKLFDALYTRFMTAEGYATFPDVRPTLTKLKRHGLRMGVISNSDERLISVIESLELNQYFDFVLPSCIAKYEKPDPEIFEQARHMVNPVVEPQNCLHVGDDVEKDYEGARKAGWHAVLLERCKLSYQDSAPPITPDASSPLPQTIISLKDLCPIACPSGNQAPPPVPSASDALYEGSNSH